MRSRVVDPVRMRSISLRSDGRGAFGTRVPAAICAVEAVAARSAGLDLSMLTGTLCVAATRFAGFTSVRMARGFDPGGVTRGAP